MNILVFVLMALAIDMHLAVGTVAKYGISIKQSTVSEALSQHVRPVVLKREG